VKSYIHKGGLKRDVPLLEEVVVIKGAGHFIQQERAQKSVSTSMTTSRSSKLVFRRH
jgi:hypothetical protein